MSVAGYARVSTVRRVPRCATRRTERRRCERILTDQLRGVRDGRLGRLGRSLSAVRILDWPAAGLLMAMDDRFGCSLSVVISPRTRKLHRAALTCSHFAVHGNHLLLT